MRHATLLVVSLGLAACGGDDDATTDGGNENEVITTVTLTFTPEAGGAPVTASFNDPDGDGGGAPTVDPVVLADGTTYTLAVVFENRLEEPPEDITEEVSDESDEHQIFFTGSAVDGPASDQPGAPLTHAYADEDANGLPIGLESSVVAAAGAGELTVTLRHLPPVNDTAVKTAELAGAVREGGFGSLGGTTDAQVDFMVTVE
jgi:hypothetical protein